MPSAKTSNSSEGVSVATPAAVLSRALVSEPLGMPVVVVVVVERVGNHQY